MQVDPSRRPTIIEVLSNPLIRDKAGMMRYSRDGSDCDSSTNLSQLSLNKKSSGASRGLLININCDLSNDEYSIGEQISPKSQVGKNHDFPVKRIDNYTKESKMQKKSQKRGDQLRRREASEPNLTPKGHSKIDNTDKKIFAKNSSQIVEKKKSVNPTSVSFKKKMKSNDSQDQISGLKLAKSLQEI